MEVSAVRNPKSASFDSSGHKKVMMDNTKARNLFLHLSLISLISSTLAFVESAWAQSLGFGELNPTSSFTIGRLLFNESLILTIDVSIFAMTFLYRPSHAKIRTATLSIVVLAAAYLADFLRDTLVIFSGSFLAINSTVFVIAIFTGAASIQAYRSTEMVGDRNSELMARSGRSVVDVVAVDEVDDIVGRRDFREHMSSEIRHRGT